MSKKLRMVVIGASLIGIGNVYIKNIIENDRAEFVALCEIDPEKLQGLAERYHLSDDMLFTDYKELLAKGGFDAVCVSTADQVHAQIAIDAMRAGYDVLCEKPMALKADECRKVIEATKETGKNFMVGQICRFTPSFVLAKKMVDNGEIGDLFYIESEYAHKYSNVNQGWRVEDPDRNVVVGGGCHAVDLIRWFAGNPSEVYAFGNQMRCDKWLYDDTTVASMKFPNGIVGKVMVSGGCIRAYTMRTVLQGTKGTIIMDNTSPTITLYKDDFMGLEKYYDVAMYRIEHNIPVEINNHNLTSELNYFVDCILDGKTIEIDGVQGCNTVIACNAIVDSSMTGKKIRPIYVE